MLVKCLKVWWRRGKGEWNGQGPSKGMARVCVSLYGKVT